MSTPSLVWAHAHGCLEPMVFKGSGCTWSGEFEITTARYACPNCPTTAEVITREHVGPPANAGGEHG